MIIAHASGNRPLRDVIEKLLDESERMQHLWRPERRPPRDGEKQGVRAPQPVVQSRCVSTIMATPIFAALEIPSCLRHR